MKSLVLKDLYNIGHNTKSMLFILGVFAVIYIPTSGVDGYIFVCALLCSMMTVTTFSFDETSKWARYAMITPVSKKDLVLGKFIVLAIFGGIGSLFGLVIGSTGGLLLKTLSFDLAEIGGLLLSTLTAWAISLIFGSISIPLVFRFGAEKARIAFLLPVAICFVIFQLLAILGIEMTDQLIFVLLCCLPILTSALCYAMYRLSCRIFARQEL